jgi:spore maturation protein A
MLLCWIWTCLVLISIVFGFMGGRIGEVSAAALEGANASLELCIGICGAVCLWSGIMEVMKRSGMALMLSKALRPVLVLLFPTAGRDVEALDALSQNVSANLLGLGNAATPAGIRAAMRLKLSGGMSDIAGDELCRLVVLNSASIQLIPATICAVRASSGSAAPFDILPAVWLTSIISVAAGLTAAFVFSRFYKKRA